MATGSMTVEPPVTGGDDGDRGDDRVLPPVAGLPWPKVIVLLAAFAFLAGSAGYLLGKGRPPSSGSVDVGFQQDMITHHEQAIQLSILEVANGADTTVMGFARDILDQQSYEIGIMDARLQSWGYSRTGRSPTAMAWMGSPVPADAMPGLATPDQMAQLRAAAGKAADALFLQLMAAHHEGGIEMATFAARHASSTGVRDLAALMAYVQASEINEFSQTAASHDLGAIAMVAVPPNPRG